MSKFERLKLRHSPNQFLVAPSGLCERAKPHLEAPIYAVPLDKLEQATLDVIRSSPRIKEREASEGEHFYRFVQRSALIGFPDEIWLQVLDVEDGSTIAIYSRSLLGYSDFGVNRKRVEAWIDELDDQLPRAL